MDKNIKEKRLSWWGRINLKPTIKVKLMLSITVLIIIINGIGSLVTFNQSSQILQESIFSAVEGTVTKEAIIINEMVKGEVAILENMDIGFLEAKYDFMKNTLGILVSTYWTDAMANYNKIAEEHEEFIKLFVATPDGKYWSTDGEGNIADEDYFQQALASEKTILSQVMSSETNGKQNIVMIRPVIIEDQLVALIGGTLSTKFIQDYVKQININGYGYGFIIDDEFRTLAHPDEGNLGRKHIVALDNQELLAIAGKMTAGKTGMAYYQVGGVEYGIVYAPIDITGWSLGITAEVNKILKPLLLSRRRNIIISLGSILLALLLSYFIANYIASPLKKISNVTAKIADGDLGSTLETRVLKSNDEVGSLARSVNEMLLNLRDIIQNIADTASQVSASSEELYAAGEQVGDVAEQVGIAIEGIASGAEEQSAQVEETAMTVEQFVEQITEVEQSSEEMNQSADKVIERIRSGNSSVKKSINQVDHVKRDTTEVAGVIKSLGKTSEEIGDIIKLINGIAAQTNLLALNAAIEAARAGEAGRGFSVVADEIRELAEDSSGATQQIADLIKDIQQGVKNAIKKMDESISSVDESVQAIKLTGEEFAEIEEVTNSLKDQIEKVAANANDMGNNSKRVKESINNIATVSNEFARSSEGVAASSEEQIASTEEIINSARQLAGMAEQLIESINRFKL